MNAARRRLLNSWRRVSAIRYEGTDGVRAYVVERRTTIADIERAAVGLTERPWRVLVDGRGLPGRFVGSENACAAAEKHSEQQSGPDVAPDAPRQGSFAWSAK